MRNRIATVFAGAMLVVSMLSGVCSANDSAPLRLEEVLNAVVEVNPEIHVGRERWAAAREKIPQAGSLPDPMFGYTYFGEEVETRDGPQESAYQLMQKFPAFGKLRLRSLVAEHAAGMASEQYQATVWDVVRRAKKTYYELYWVHKAIRITGEIKELLKRFEKVASTRYTTGKGGQQNVLRAQLEISKLNKKLFNLEQMKTTVTAKLNTLMNRSPEEVLGNPADLEISPLAHELEELYRLGELSRQEVRAAGLATEKAEASYRLSRREYLPDVTAAVRYVEIGEGSAMSPDSGEDAWAATLSVNLPIWRGRLRGAVNEAGANLQASRERLVDVRNTTSFQIKDAYFRVVTANDEIELYRDSLMPQAEQLLKATEVAYETGKATFLDLLDSERALLGIRIGYHRSVADHQKHMADLERAVGVELIEQ